MEIPVLSSMRRVIIIEDEQDLAKSLAIMLSNLGYEVVISTAASNAFDLRDDDIVFLDVLMPDTSGLQVLEHLSQQERNCSIILMSGNPERLDGAEKYAKSLNLNLLGALEKPFRLADVQEVLERAWA